MTLLQIHEPGQTPMPHSEENKIAVGIDLGTTNSLVAISKSGKPEIIRDRNGKALIPSVVTYGDEILVGNDAIVNSGRFPHVIRSVKRLMGKGKSDVSVQKSHYEIAKDDGALGLLINGKKITPTEISAEILKYLKKSAEQALGLEVSDAVITVPAYFDDAARAATKDAARLAGLNILRLINEPTAAALAYGLDKGAEGVYAVYDLGGGTFDISILRMEKGVFQVLSTGGSTEIGGDDLDYRLAEIFIKKTGLEGFSSLKSELLEEAKKVKQQLTDNESVEFIFNSKGDEYKAVITRGEFNESVKDYIDKTIDISLKAIEDSGVNKDDIKGIVLVGGSTRVPLVRSSVRNFFGKEPLTDINPDEVVAYGAAIQSEGLTKGSDNLLLDVIPLSLGIETMGDIVEKIIYRNTAIPVAKAQEFTTYKDGQSGMVIHVVQGERELASQNRSLARFEVKNIPPMAAGAARIKVTFAVDADGLLTVSAREETTGSEQVVEVKPSYGLSEEEIRTMLYDSMKYGREDMENRLLAEVRVEAGRIADAAQIALKEDGNLLTEEEKRKIEDSINNLITQLSSSDRNIIDSLTKELIDVTNKFAEIRMDKYIKDAIQGKKVGEI